MPKVLITTSSFGQYDSSPLNKLRSLDGEIVLNPWGRKLSKEESLQLYSDDVDGVIAGTEEISCEVLVKAKSLKVISRCGIGLDNVDLDTAKTRKIQVFRTSSVVADAVSELTLGLILSTLRFIPQADRSVRQGKWEKPMGYLLKNKTVGIVGLGTVGKRLVELLKPFVCTILAYDIIKDKGFAKKNKVTYVDLNKLFNASHVVSIHLPFSEQTKNLVNLERIHRMKKDAVIINTSRGEIVDEEALYQALKSKSISGAALDVFQNEPYQGPLCELDNVILTSHIGSYAREVRVTMEREAVDNLIKGLKKSKK